MLNKTIPVATLTTIVILLVILNFTTPAGIGPLGILLFFALIYALMLGVSVLIVKAFRKALQRKGGMRSKDYMYAAVIAFAPIMLLLAKSLGSLSIFTFILVILFVLLGCFLVYKRV